MFTRGVQFNDLNEGPHHFVFRVQLYLAKYKLMTILFCCLCKINVLSLLQIKPVIFRQTMPFVDTQTFIFILAINLTWLKISH